MVKPEFDRYLAKAFTIACDKGTEPATTGYLLRTLLQMPSGRTLRSKMSASSDEIETFLFRTIRPAKLRRHHSKWKSFFHPSLSIHPRLVLCTLTKQKRTPHASKDTVITPRNVGINHFFLEIVMLCPPEQKVYVSTLAR